MNTSYEFPASRLSPIGSIVTVSPDVLVSIKTSLLPLEVFLSVTSVLSTSKFSEKVNVILSVSVKSVTASSVSLSMILVSTRKL